MSRVQSIVSPFFLILLIAAAGAETVVEKCSGDFQKVSTCLSFATGKAATPTKECCSTVEDIKDRDPVCLCYFIQQTHNGSNAQIKSLGIQVAKLLQLPSVCNLANASVTDCPKLLNILPSSPDYAIFTNISATTAPSTGTGTSTPGGSNGISKLGPNFGGLVGAIAFTIFLYVLAPFGFVSTFST